MHLCICEGETVTSREGILWVTQLRLTKRLRLLRFGLGSDVLLKKPFPNFAQVTNASILATDASVSLLLQFCSKPFPVHSCLPFHGSLPECPPHSRYKQFKSCWAHSTRPAMTSYDQLLPACTKSEKSIKLA